MNKSVKGIAMVAGAMVLVGIVLAGIGFIAGGNQSIYFDRTGVHIGNEGDSSDGNMESLSENLNRFSSIRTDLDYYNVELIPSDKYAIEANYDSKYGKPNFKIENGTLIVEDGDHKRFNINIDLGGLKFFSNNEKLGVKIYYPKDAEFKNIKIRGAASEMSFKDLKAENTEFDLNFGSLNLTNISARTIKVSMDSGDCTLKNIKSDELNVTNDLGDTALDGGTVKSLVMEANSGDVTIDGVTAESGELNLDLGTLTVKDIISNGLKAEANSGDIVVQGTLLGTTDINCDMGTVTVHPGGTKDQFNYELKADMGSIHVDDVKSSGSVSNSSGSAAGTLKITTNMGDINLNFN